MNPYQILGIPENATEEQIKHAFREKAKATHPDKNPGNPTAAKQFNDVVEAYNILMGAPSYGTTGFNNDSERISPQDVQEFIRAMKTEVQPYKSAAFKYMLSGLAWFVGGLIVTIGSISIGQGVIAIGAILFGGIEAIRGFVHYVKINHEINKLEKELWDSLTDKRITFTR